MSAKSKEVSSGTEQTVRDESAGENTIMTEKHESLSKSRNVVEFLKSGARELWIKLKIIAKRLVRHIQAKLPAKKYASKTYRFLARQLVADLAVIEGTPKIVFSSTDDLEVNSEVLLMIAYFLQDEFDCKVLLIDGTLSKGGLSNYLEIENSTGFTDYFCGEHDSPNSLITTTAHENIFVMPAGSTPLPKRLRFDRTVLDSQLKNVGRGFDYVFIQQGGILEDTRYLDFNEIADLVMLHVAEQETRLSEFEACQKAYDDHMIHGVKIILSE